MDSTRHDLLNRLLIAGAEELELTPTQHARAVGHYEAVGEYLAERGSPLERYSPTVFAQGSMAIGTATKPVGRDEFDLDLMCQLLIRSSANPAEVKRIVGERLRANDTYKKMLHEKNRCWRLVYVGEFHMDIIPGIPDPQGQTATALLVPDKELRCWKETDPKGYAAWVLARAKITAIASEVVRAEVEPAPSSPDGRQKFPLQVIVQLLKRHRDLMFVDDEDAPISIIITTLAARAYDGSRSVIGALSGVLERMPRYVMRTNTGAAFVDNPVNPLENFADKWVTHPRREQCFVDWIAQARLDLERLESARLTNMQNPLSCWVGQPAATRAIKAYAQTIQSQRDTRIAVSAATGELASKSAQAVVSPRHTFFGQ